MCVQLAYYLYFARNSVQISELQAFIRLQTFVCVCISSETGGRGIAECWSGRCKRFSFPKKFQENQKRKNFQKKFRKTKKIKIKLPEKKFSKKDSNNEKKLNKKFKKFSKISTSIFRKNKKLKLQKKSETKIRNMKHWNTNLRDRKIQSRRTTKTGKNFGKKFEKKFARNI